MYECMYVCMLYIHIYIPSYVCLQHTIHYIQALREEELSLESFWIQPACTAWITEQSDSGTP